jgi:hypothetical protein
MTTLSYSTEAWGGTVHTRKSLVGWKYGTLVHSTLHVSAVWKTDISTHTVLSSTGCY